jgi:hypothetical protein
MIGDEDKRQGAPFLREYQKLVVQLHPERFESWPLLQGWNLLIGSYRGWKVVVFKDSVGSSMESSSGVGELSEALIGSAKINAENRDQVRLHLERHFNIGLRDAIALFAPDDNIRPELIATLRRHERALGLDPMMIFLSHKGADKPVVREFKQTLELLGFRPWLDEDAMPAGTNLHRGILEGFENSCAAIFFITENFEDEKFLATEVDYAITQEQKKGKHFAIITLVLNGGTAREKVPDLLRRYVWKEPTGHLDALREILRALPVQVGAVNWKF